MTYSKIIDDDYIFGVCAGVKGSAEITEEEYNNILALFLVRPTAPEGFVYKLRASDFEWVLAEAPADPPEPDPEPTVEDKAEAYDILMGVSE